MTSGEIDTGYRHVIRAGLRAVSQVRVGMPAASRRIFAAILAATERAIRKR